MTCRELSEFLSDYLERSLPPDVSAAFERHLKLCPPCVSYLRSFEETIRLGKDACKGCDPPEVPEELIRAVLKARKGVAPS